MIEQLLAEREIHRVLCALATAMDQRDWGAFDHVFVPEATGNFGEGVHPASREEIVAMFRRFLGNCGPTQHLLGNLVVEFDGDTAWSTCYCRDVHQGAGENRELLFQSPGEYRDTWRRTAQGWRIVHRHKVTLMTIGSIKALGLE